MVNIKNFSRLLAVCCELREGLSQHKLLRNSKKIGEFLSNPEFTLISIDDKNEKVGLKKGNNSVFFEVYEVNLSVLHDVSVLKKYYGDNYSLNFHKREEIQTPFGKAVTYFELKTEITKENIIEDYDYVDYLIYNKIK